MCGIFGVALKPDPEIPQEFAGQVVERLFRFSQTRGREAAGLAVYSGASIDVVKQAGSVSDFVRCEKYAALMQQALDRHTENLRHGRQRALAITGHSRLVTNGLQSTPENNQPIVAVGTVGIHNGIIVNDGELLTSNPDLETQSDSDTEVLVRLLRKHFDATRDIIEAMRLTYDEIAGSASVALFLDDLDSLVLATNTGSLFFGTNERRTLVAFASERYILRRLFESGQFKEVVGHTTVQQLRAGSGLLVSLRDLQQDTFNSLGSRRASRTGTRQLADSDSTGNGHGPGRRVQIVDHTKNAHNLRRCTRCILPETYPFVDFDQQGVCSWCRGWRTIQVKGEEALLRAVEPYRSADGSPDVIVAFSGGRDSSYGLHYVKTRLGMNPVAFTYDWGMVTDLARRNQARLCGTLGIEHIVRSADIATKRRYVRKNIEAWLKKPELGMVTLFTAGDKEFYQHARQLRKETGIKLVIFCAGNMIEDTPYKTGLCGIRERDHGMTLTGLAGRDGLRLLGYFARNYLTNPSYFNESFWDTLNAYWQTFVVKDDFLYLYHYIPWHEETIVGTIRREYDWEIAPDTSSTWRIGYWTASFYNYIYGTIAGWTEDEVMLSNMIREGVHTRDHALELAEEYRKPRLPTLQGFAQAVGFNCEEALNIINAAPKLY